MKQGFKISLRQGFSLGLIALLPILGNLLSSANARANLNNKNNNNLTVEIDGLKNKKGQICLSLFSRRQGFPDNSKNALESKCIKITETPQKVIFSNLKTGNYAVAVIHDANGDGTLNTNSFGIPTEAFGFSNNPLILTKAPTFNESAVLVVGSNTNIQIKLQNLLGG
ncbi:MAG: DUF2141 domain-containing protein [Cuspidothrix sp.]|jgi:uncharacterized protein (DUF2141 family)